MEAAPQSSGRKIIPPKVQMMTAVKNSVWLTILLAALAFGPLTSRGQDAPQLSKRDVIYRIAPVYPDLARRCNLRGEVKLTVVVSPEGKVTSSTVAGGNPVLAQAAVDSVRNWKFAPAPHATTEQIELRFGR
jgi:TonB family protein